MCPQKISFPIISAVYGQVEKVISNRKLCPKIIPEAMIMFTLRGQMFEFLFYFPLA